MNSIRRAPRCRIETLSPAPRLSRLKHLRVSHPAADAPSLTNASVGRASSLVTSQGRGARKGPR